MEFREIVTVFEQNAAARAAAENPSYISSSAKVAEVVDSVTGKMYQGSMQMEQEAGYSWIPEPKAKSKPGFWVTGNGLMYQGIRVSNFCYKIRKMEILISGTSNESYKGYKLEIEVTVFRAGQEESQVLRNVTREQLESVDLMKKIPFAASDTMITKSDFRNIMYSYANHLLETFFGEVIYVTQSTGWLNFKGRWLYVDARKAIGAPDVLLHANGSLQLNNSVSVNNLWQEFQNMRNVLKGKGQMDALLLYVLISFVFTLYQEAGKTTKHCMFLVGARATRKTALALCFSQLENKETPEFNFLATESGIQSHFQNYHDSCLLIDDLAPSCNSTKRSASEQKLEMIIRLFGDAGKRVINTFFTTTSAENLDYSVRGGAIITGEYFYSAGVESSIARTVVLELESESVDLKRLTYFQKRPEILETLIYRFLVYISNHWEECKKVIREVTEQYRLQYQNFFSNGRFADYMGQYMAQANLVKNFFQQEAGINENVGNAYCNQILEGISGLLVANDCKMMSRAPINTLLMAIHYMTEIGRCVDWGEALSAEQACLIETETAFYLRQKDLADILKLYCMKTGEPYIKMTSQELGKLLNQAEICTKYHEGTEERLAKKYPKDYGNVRLMELLKEAVYEKIGPLLRNNVA